MGQCDYGEKNIKWGRGKTTSIISQALKEYATQEGPKFFFKNDEIKRHVICRGSRPTEGRDPTLSKRNTASTPLRGEKGKVEN